jgi:trimeric autotransporter adhesin
MSEPPTPLPIGGNGVRISQSAHDNMVWSNVITNAAANGVLLLHDAGSGNRITQNQIFGNALLGIDLLTDELDPGGPTLNDALDGDVGPNDLQNFPVIEGISGTGQIVGTVSSSPSSFHTIELFQSPVCDPSGYGEGATFVGTVSTTTDDAGEGAFAVTPLVPLSAGSFLTATATSGNGSTSELSACFLVVEALFKDGFESGNTTAWSVTESGNP